MNRHNLRLSCGATALLAVLLFSSFASAGAADGRLDVYFVDVEGGAATLIVTPAGESLLIDTGNPGERDSGRIAEAAKLAGLTKLDFVVITHYHGDHYGGLAPLSKLIPIGQLYDHLDENPSRDKPSADYLATKVDKRSLISAGDVLPLKQGKGAKLTVLCLGARKKFIDAPAGSKQNPFASESKGKPLDLSDNANSVVQLLTFGDFRFFDAGDLTWNIENDLVNPVNKVGSVDVYQVTHHGLAQSNNPVLVKAITPTVAIMNNGPTKGSEPEAFAALKATPSIQAIFQLHKNVRPDGDVNNTTAEYIANEERTPECKGNYVKMSVSPDGSSYTVSIPATKFEKTYQTKKHQ